MKFSTIETSWLEQPYLFVSADREWERDLGVRFITNWPKVEKWCQENFGPPGRSWDIGAQRYYLNSGGIFFRDPEDVTLFLLHWS